MLLENGKQDKRTPEGDEGKEKKEKGKVSDARFDVRALLSSIFSPPPRFASTGRVFAERVRRVDRVNEKKRDTERSDISAATL